MCREEQVSLPPTPAGAGIGLGNELKFFKTYWELLIPTGTGLGCSCQGSCSHLLLGHAPKLLHLPLPSSHDFQQNSSSPSSLPWEFLQWLQEGGSLWPFFLAQKKPRGAVVQLSCAPPSSAKCCIQLLQAGMGRSLRGRGTLLGSHHFPVADFFFWQE